MSKEKYDEELVRQIFISRMNKLKGELNAILDNYINGEDLDWNDYDQVDELFNALEK